MYIFISAVFFLVMSSQSPDETKPGSLPFAARVINPVLQHLADSVRGLEVKRRARLSVADSVKDTVYQALAKHLDTTVNKKDISESLAANFDNNGILKFTIGEHKYPSVKVYDSIQNKLPAKLREGRLGRYFTKKMIRLARGEGKGGIVVIEQNIEHDVPKIMFVLLPLFAFFISLFYSRKVYYYSQHFIFSMHFHSFVFIVLLLDMLTGPLINSFTGVYIVVGLTLAIILVYLIAGLRTAYGQSLWLSAIKGIGISVLYFVVTLIGICLAVFGAFLFL
jgi:hypothetical protein